MKLLDYVNEKTNNAYKDYKLVSVIFDRSKKECVLKFLYKNEINDDDKSTLQKLVAEYLKVDISIIIKCKKAYADSDLVKDVIYNFLTRNYASVCVGFEKDNITADVSDEIYVTISCNKFQHGYLSSSEIKKEILEYAESFFFEPFNLELEYADALEIIEEENIPANIFFEESESNIKYTKIDNVKSFIGEVSSCPINISCIKGAMENIEIAGTIRFFSQKSFTSKRKDKDGNQIEKVYFGFTLVDKTGRMNCVYFPLKSDELKAIQLKDDDVVVVHGDVEDFNGRINFKVKSLAYCALVEEENVEIVVDTIKEPNADYLFVKPEPYVEMFQDNLFAEKEVIGEYMQNNDIVVFDIETTGLEATVCEILEIGAVKIKNGVITETFETLIKPNVPIPEEITQLTGITESMVADAPNIKQVLPDFYKFCYGTTIMAYNIDFDYKFISIQGRKLGYVFDMKQIDAMYLARAFIPGLKNFKLSSVCKKLGVSLENAHRAVHDATATAEVVIKLNTHIK